MTKRKLTPEEMAAKVAKMKATKAANKAKALEAVGYTPTKKKIIGYCHWWEMPICNGKSNILSWLLSSVSAAEF